MTIEEVRKYQLAQLELMRLMHELCDKLNLTYYLIGGTLLGAVRHGGFIPWDPDIDIAMPREDYEKIREYFSQLDSDRYLYQHYSTEKNHLFPHALVRIKDSYVELAESQTRFKPSCEGIYLDIFPLDTPPVEKKLQEKQMRRIKFLKEVIYFKSERIFAGNSAVVKLGKRIVSRILFPFSFEFLNRKMDECMRRYNDSNSGYLVSMASHYSYKKQLMPKDVYGTPIKMPFEGDFFFAPEKTENYLNRIYGDYMRLPSEEDQQAMLNFVKKVEYTLEEKPHDGE